MGRPLKKPRKARAREPKRDPDATRAALLAAGERVFAAKSFEGATFDAIAAEAGVNKALIAYYFGSKEGLHDAVIEAIVRDVLTDVAARMGAETRDAAKNFASYIRALTMALWERPSMPAILLREYLSGSMLRRKSPFANVSQFFRTTERLYEAGRKAGAFRAADAHILHLAIVGPIIHFIVARDVRKRTLALAPDIGDPAVDAFAKGLSRLVLEGLAPK
jgi:AcrR family transcriptional regulator